MKYSRGSFTTKRKYTPEGKEYGHSEALSSDGWMDVGLIFISGYNLGMKYSYGVLQNRQRFLGTLQNTTHALC